MEWLLGGQDGACSGTARPKAQYGTRRKYKESGIAGTEGEGGMLAPGSRKGNVCRADCCPLQKRLGLGKGVRIEDPS